MATMNVEFQDGERIVFEARRRATVNVRAAGDDGQPIGFTSFELLLAALANCTLGTVRGHESLNGVPVRGLRATLEAEPATAPSRVARITVRIDLDIDGAEPGGGRLGQTLARAAGACPVGNTLRQPPEIVVELAVNGAPVPSAPATVRAG